MLRTSNWSHKLLGISTLSIPLCGKTLLIPGKTTDISNSVFNHSQVCSQIRPEIFRPLPFRLPGLVRAGCWLKRPVWTRLIWTGILILSMVMGGSKLLPHLSRTKSSGWSGGTSLASLTWCIFTLISNSRWLETNGVRNELFLSDFCSSIFLLMSIQYHSLGCFDTF